MWAPEGSPFAMNAMLRANINVYWRCVLLACDVLYFWRSYNHLPVEVQSVLTKVSRGVNRISGNFSESETLVNLGVRGQRPRRKFLRVTYPKTHFLQYNRHKFEQTVLLVYPIFFLVL